MKNVLNYFLTLKEKKLEPHWAFQQLFLPTPGEGQGRPSRQANTTQLLQLSTILFQQLRYNTVPQITSHNSDNTVFPGHFLQF